MEKIIELLIQKTYLHCKDNYYRSIQEKLPFLKQKDTFLISFHNSFVSFEGWELNYERYGRTLSRQSTYFGEMDIYHHSIKLNRHFLMSLMGYNLPPENLLAYRFTFAKLLDTVAEEVAHCLVRELYPSAEEHGSEFKEIKIGALNYLKKERVVSLVREELKKHKIDV